MTRKQRCKKQNRGVRNKPDESGSAHPRGSGGTNYLNVGSRNSHTKLEKRKSDEAQPSRAQSSKATVTKDNGLGFSKEATFSMGPNQMGHFIQGTTTKRDGSQ